MTGSEASAGRAADWWTAVGCRWSTALSKPGSVLQSVALLLWLGASWWVCLADGAGLTSAGACWVLEIYVKRWARWRISSTSHITHIYTNSRGFGEREGSLAMKDTSKVYMWGGEEKKHTSNWSYYEPYLNLLKDNKDWPDQKLKTKSWSLSLVKANYKNTCTTAFLYLRNNCRSVSVCGKTTYTASVVFGVPHSEKNIQHSLNDCIAIAVVARLILCGQSSSIPHMNNQRN